MCRVAINGARNNMNSDINRSWQMSGFGLSRLGQVKGKIPEPGHTIFWCGRKPCR